MGVVRGYLTSMSLASGEVSPPRSAGAPAFEKCRLKRKQLTGSLRQTRSSTLDAPGEALAALGRWEQPGPSFYVEASFLSLFGHRISLLCEP